MLADPTEAKLLAILQNTRLIHRQVAAAVEVLLAGTGLTLSTRAVLDIIDLYGAQTVPDIARHRDLTRQAVQAATGALLAQDLVKAEPNPRHQRSPLFALTDRGRALMARVRTAESTAIADLCQSLDREDLRTTAAVLDRIHQHFTQLKSGAT